MQAIAAFVLRGRNQAILSTVGFAALALMFTPLGLFSAASIGLVTLVHGAKQGFTIVVIASIFMLAISSFTGQVALGIEYVVFYWLPVWFLALLLARQVSLSLVVLFAALIGLVAAVVMATLYVTYEAQWNKIILDNLLPAFKDAKMDLSEEELKTFILNIGKMVVNYGAAYWVLSMSASLFLARWWQALLFHPGGFGEEFRELRFGVSAAIGAMLIIAVAIVVSDGLLNQILMGSVGVVVLLFVLQGLAIAHTVAVARKLKTVWLYLLYLLMIVLMPYELFLIAFIGLSDNWANYRARIKPV